jgi:hypothetical protein
MSEQDGRFTETTQQGWLSRLGGALGGMLFGLALIPIGCVVLFWNEGRAVQTARSLAEGAGLVTAIQADRVNPANEGRLVHVSGALTIANPPRDADFNLTPPAGTLRLTRRVEMYQWQEKQESETRNRLGGGTETVTTYSYSRAWVEGRVDSSRFRQPEGRTNPTPRHESRDWTAEGVRLGAFRLATAQLGDIPAGEALPAPRGGGNTLYLGADPENPRVGDLRISWMAARPEAISLIAAQVGEGFGPYATRAGDRLFLMVPERQPASAMFQAAEADNAVLTWILRLVGSLAILFGWSLLFNPMKVLADVVPIIGSIVGAGTGLVAFLLTLVIAPAVIGLAWLFYRPLIGLAVLCLTALGIFGLMRLRRRKPVVPV